MDDPTLCSGLDNIVVAATALSRVDGERGELIVRGHDIRELALEREFEEVCALLWTGELSGARDMGRELAAGRQLAHQALPDLGGALATSNGMDALRAALAHWPSPEREDVGAAARLTGAVAGFAAAWWRREQGAEPVPPDASLGHAADVLRMLHGAAPSRAAARALSTYLTTVVDHGMNASTFAARVVTSTGSDMVSAVVAALGALKGPLHGGAPGPVLDMLDAIAEPGAAAAWLDGELAAGRRIMGMGHRVYRVRDPRAAVLERAAESLGDTGRLALARAVEACAVERLRARHPDRALRANVEFYTAVLLDALGIDRRMFSPTFAMARTAGWIAHVFEQRAAGRLIRPKARYVGPLRAGA